MTDRLPKKGKRFAAIPRHELPLARWNIEIFRRTRSAVMDKAFCDAQRQYLERQLEHNRDVLGKFTAIVLGEIIYELRVAKEVYTAGLAELNRKLAIREAEENLGLYAVEYAIAPYAAACLRRELQRYLESAKIPFERLQRLFDPLWPGHPRSKSRSVLQEDKSAKSITELLTSLIPDDIFQGITKGNPFDPEGPFGISHIQVARIPSSEATGTSLPEMLDLHKAEMWWIEPAIFLWSGTLDEVAALCHEAEMEIYGRRLTNLERTDVDKVVSLYAEMKPARGKIADKDLAKVAQLADSVGLGPTDVLGKNGREALNAINARRRQHAPDTVVNTIVKLVQETKRVPQHGDRSLQAYFTKFLSDRLNSRVPSTKFR